MMKSLPLQGRTLALLAVLAPLLALLAYVAMRSGPLAAIPVTVTTVTSRSIAPDLYGIGSIEARYSYRVGPTMAGRLQHVNVQVGDRVKARQLLGEMDPVDLDARIRAQQAALARAEAQQREAQARQRYAQTQLHRYEQLLKVRSTSEEVLATRQQELQVADAALEAAVGEVTRSRAEHAALVAQRQTLRLLAPVDGLVVARDAEPGSTVIAGSPVIQLIDPQSLWINVRFDQISAHGLAAGLPAKIALRSRSGESLSGRVLRVEPLADTVTEEILAKVVFDQLPDPLPPVGELAEVHVSLPGLPDQPTLPRASLRHVDGRQGVWRIEAGRLQFVAVQVGAGDLDGQVQILSGLKPDDRVVVYSQRTLHARSKLTIVDVLPGVTP